MMADSQRIESLKELQAEPGGIYQRWQSEITNAEKEKDLERWRKRARKIVKEFRAERYEASGIDPSMERRFNLFAANINIMTTALIKLRTRLLTENSKTCKMTWRV
jgi:ADP-ribosylglycohydrolase